MCLQLKATSHFDGPRRRVVKDGGQVATPFPQAYHPSRIPKDRSPARNVRRTIDLIVKGGCYPSLLRTRLLQAARNRDRAQIALEDPALEHSVYATIVHAPVHPSRLRATPPISSSAPLNVSRPPAYVFIPWPPPRPWFLPPPPPLIDYYFQFSLWRASRLILPPTSALVTKPLRARPRSQLIRSNIVCRPLSSRQLGIGTGSRTLHEEWPSASRRYAVVHSLLGPSPS